MNCNKTKLLLSAYIDSEIEPEQEKKLLEHIKTCDCCNKELEYLKQTKKLFILKKKEEPKEFFETRLFSLIKSANGQPILNIFFPIFKRIVPIILILVLLIIGTVSLRKFFINKISDIDLMDDFFVEQQEFENFEKGLINIYYSD